MDASAILLVWSAPGPGARKHTTAPTPKGDGTPGASHGNSRASATAIDRCRSSQSGKAGGAARKTTQGRRRRVQPPADGRYEANAGKVPPRFGCLQQPTSDGMQMQCPSTQRAVIALLVLLSGPATATRGPSKAASAEASRRPRAEPCPSRPWPTACLRGLAR